MEYSSSDNPLNSFIQEVMEIKELEKLNKIKGLLNFSESDRSSISSRYVIDHEYSSSVSDSFSLNYNNNKISKISNDIKCNGFIRKKTELPPLKEERVLTEENTDKKEEYRGLFPLDRLKVESRREVKFVSPLKYNNQKIPKYQQEKKLLYSDGRYK